jgi:simple sugar transport system permease protein
MPDRAANLRRWLGPHLNHLVWPLASLALLLAFNALATPGFFTLEWRDGRIYGVLVDILNHGSRTAIVALGMTLVIATGGVDLSVGAIAAIAGAVTASLLVDAHAPWPLAIAAALGAGLLCGLWNGFLVAVLKLQPIVATLVLMVAGRGIAQLITSGSIITFQSPEITSIGNGSLLALPVPVTLLAAAALTLALFVRRTSLGLFIEAVGDNDVAARLAGVPDRAVKLLAYLVCGVLAAVAGIIECSYIKAADANNAGSLLELDTILAVVIGGTALRGGRFALAGTIVGALLMQTLTKTLYMQNVSADIAPAPKALVVIIVCLLQAPAFRTRLRSLLPKRSHA